MIKHHFIFSLSSEAFRLLPSGFDFYVHQRLPLRENRQEIWAEFYSCGIKRMRNMNDWKAGKLLKNCVQIAVAVLGYSSKAIPLHRKKQVRTGSSLMRSSSAIRGIRRDKKEVSTKDRKGNGALPECGNRLGYKSVRRDVPCKEKSRTDFSVLLLNYGQAATSSDWGYSSG